MALTVSTTGGRVAGREEGTLRVFRGIPFASAPRWWPPGPAERWVGTRDAFAFGPAAPQGPGFPTVLPLEDVNGWDEERCLTVNVWAPRHANARPVLVWFHGGSFLTGSSAMPLYDCARLAAEHDVVVLSANYRLGALGYAPVAGCTNVGVLDQLACLAWVRDNATAFGGDPDNVTIFGESAGAGSVLHLLAAPRSTGLVRRAIAQSGATNFTPTAEQMGEVADRLRHRVDPGAPAAEIIDAQAAVTRDLMRTRGPMPFHPTIDGDIIPARPQEGLPLAVDLLIGTTRDELSLYVDDWELSEDEWRVRAARYLENLTVARPGVVIASYETALSPARRWAELRTDGDMWLPCLDVAEAHAGRTYVYRFDWPAAPPNERLGACHAIDLPFTFGTFDVGSWGAFVGAGPDASAVGTALRAAWAGFAAGEEPWPAYDPVRRATMVFDRERRVLDDPRGTVREAWRAGQGAAQPRAAAR